MQAEAQDTQWQQFQPAELAVLDAEHLVPEHDSLLLAAKGSRADTEVLQVTVQSAGPFNKPGTYRYLRAWICLPCVKAAYCTAVLQRIVVYEIKRHAWLERAAG